MYCEKNIISKQNSFLVAVKMATRWGIASAGKISSDFVTAMKAQKDDHRVVAVGARSLADAQAFAKKYGAEKSYGSYEELSKDPDVGQFYVEILVIGFYSD